MSPLTQIGDLVTRGAYLLALALAPPLLSPAPGPSAGAGAGVRTAAAALTILVVLFAAGGLRARLGGRPGLAAAVLVGAAVAAALIGADLFHGARGPLGRGALYVGVPLWAGLTVVAGEVGKRRFGSRVLAIVAVALLAVGLFGASGWVFSSQRMWIAALRHDGENVSAVDELTGAALRAKRYDEVVATMDRCVAATGACACLARRAEVRTRTGPPDAALAEAGAVVERCPSSSAARVASAEALAFHGDAEAAEQSARAGLEKGDDGRLRYVLAIALDREGRRAEALDEAKRAVRLGAGRDGALLLGSLAITAGSLDLAAEALQPLIAASPDDADALYDLALVADRRDDFNGAREGYLAALRADPRLSAARYNLVILTLRSGAVDEAKHHAQRFASAFPDDPRGAQLAKRVTDAARPR